LTLIKNQTVLDLPVTGLKLTLKEFEPDPVVGQGDVFLKVGTGVSTAYLHYTKIDSARAKSALSNYEDDSGTYFYALAEFEVTYTNEWEIGPSSIVRSTKTFLIRVDRDLTANT